MTTYYKLLDGNKPSNGGNNCDYNLPQNNKPGKWMPKISNIELCRKGYHITTIEHLLKWTGNCLYIAEFKGNILHSIDKSVTEQIRLISIIPAWNATNLRLFSADCAEHVLPIFEKKYPNDKRPRNAIKAARQFAREKISLETLIIAKNAATAYAAANAAAYTAAYAADAAYAAANATAYAAAYAAADAAAYAAANAAADAAADAGGHGGAQQKEKDWQIKLLKKYLNVKD